MEGREVKDGNGKEGKERKAEGREVKDGKGKATRELQ